MSLILSSIVLLLWDSLAAFASNTIYYTLEDGVYTAVAEGAEFDADETYYTKS